MQNQSFKWCGEHNHNVTMVDSVKIADKKVDGNEVPASSFIGTSNQT